MLKSEAWRKGLSVCGSEWTVVMEVGFEWSAEVVEAKTTNGHRRWSCSVEMV